MGNDALLSEVDRQRKYLSLLPADYAYPLFNAQQALESQRRSGYKDTASASREIVDNAIEAGATRVDILFDTRNQQGGKAVKAVAFIDNGSGMLPDMVRYALSWGGGTHLEDHAFMGRFGFGLPNASINQARRVEVLSHLLTGTVHGRSWTLTPFTRSACRLSRSPCRTNCQPSYVST